VSYFDRKYYPKWRSEFEQTASKIVVYFRLYLRSSSEIVIMLYMFELVILFLIY